MSRPTTISDEAILEAARHVFLTRGPSGTTAEVAARLGISEGSIYKRWKTKIALFHAAMSISEEGSWIATLSSRIGKGELKTQLTELALAMIELFRSIIPLHMLSASLGDDAHTAMRRPDSPAIVARRRLAAYFEAERRLGRIRQVDCDVLARTMIGALYSFVALAVMTGDHDPNPIDDQTYARGLVDVLLHGVVPADKAPASAKRPVRRPKG